MVMNKMKQYFLIGVMASSAVSSLYSVCFDNRFLPWYPLPVPRTSEVQSWLKSEMIFVTGDSAYGSPTQKKKGIPELWGTFDQRVLTDASVAAGNTNRLRPAWQSSDIAWGVYGKINGYGLTFKSEFAFSDLISVGFQTGFLHLNSTQKFVLNHDTVHSLVLTAADEQEIERNRRDTLEDLGFTQNEWSKTALVDSQAYLRLGWAKEYYAKCRQTNVGVTMGIFLPSAKQRDETNPAAIPFGGQNMFGMFWGLDGNFELKEDIWFNVLFNLSKRFKKTQTRRIPLRGEPEIFGATSGAVQVSPGVSLMVTPGVVFDDLQSGFGLGLNYVFAYHARDVWTDKRTDKSLTLDISNISKNSIWKSEYFLFNLFYDFSRTDTTRKFAPVLSLSWDIPTKIFRNLDVAKTQRVGLSIECTF